MKDKLKILVLDNYDSFTWNLVHYLDQCADVKIDVFRNDEISLEDAGGYDKILLSPGPGLPSDAGIMNELIRKYSPLKSILGVCLGQQAIAEVFGGRLVNLERVFHGVATTMKVVKPDVLFEGIPGSFSAGRYHSWVVDKNSFPPELEITAVDEDSNIMALRHRKFDVRGVQFHPESIMTEHGLKMICNWVNA